MFGRPLFPAGIACTGPDTDSVMAVSTLEPAGQPQLSRGDLRLGLPLILRYRADAMLVIPVETLAESARNADHLVTKATTSGHLL